MKLGPLPAPKPVKPETLSVIKCSILPPIVCFLIVAVCCQVVDHWSPKTNVTNSESEFDAISSVVVLCYWVALHGVRFALLGHHYLAEMLWGCNISLLITAVGLWSNRPILIGCATCIVAVDQLCWYVDLASYAITSKFHIGVAKYMADPETPTAHLFTGTHHIWFLPLAMYSLRATGMPAGSYALSIMVTGILAVAARLLTPYAVFHQNGVKIFNINLCYEFWHDLPFGFLHVLDHHSPFIYLPTLIVACNLVLNIVPVYIVYEIAELTHRYNTN